MLAIPRLPYGWPGHDPDYKENGIVEPFPLDKTWHVPTEEDIIAPVDEIEDEDTIELLLSKDLISKLDD